MTNSTCPVGQGFDSPSAPGTIRATKGRFEVGYEETQLDNNLKTGPRFDAAELKGYCRIATVAFAGATAGHWSSVSAAADGCNADDHECHPSATLPRGDGNSAAGAADVPCTATTSQILKT